ncbi:MAG: ribonuclease P protein component [Actinomycetota bacterium]
MREQTLRRTSEFKRVFAEGRKVVAPELIIHCARNFEGAGRLGIVVSRRNGNAVQRNRIRRRLKEAVRILGGVTPGFDVVVVARPAAKEARFDRLREQLWKILANPGSERTGMETSSGA